MALTIYNTLTREKQFFKPIDPKNVRMYVCGPTVYDYAHIGNARPVIVFDVLFRLLRHIYGEQHVTYVRNITDVEDKIIARAAERNVSIRELTDGTARVYQEDALALGNLKPTLEPRVTETMPEIVAMIQKLIANNHAYEAEGHVLFHVPSDPDYGKLARRSLDEMIAGARVEVAPYKKNPMDFVLWKPSDENMIGWDSPWGRGRPGWHIECSAMGEKHLGETFDIHAGGIDLIFPHHENEIAQSEGVHHKPIANYWMHNGFLQVEGEKMSKSLGNFITIRELLAERKFGGQPWHGLVLRLAMLGTHYRQPIDWTVDRLAQARSTLFEWSRLLHGAKPADDLDEDFLGALQDDLNTPSAFAVLYALAATARTNLSDRSSLKRALNFLGIYNDEVATDFAVGYQAIDGALVEKLIVERNAARKAKNFAEADRIRDKLSAMGVAIEDGPSGTTWKIGS